MPGGGGVNRTSRVSKAMTPSRNGLSGSRWAMPTIIRASSGVTGSPRCNSIHGRVSFSRTGSGRCRARASRTSSTVPSLNRDLTRFHARSGSSPISRPRLARAAAPANFRSRPLRATSQLHSFSRTCAGSHSSGMLRSIAAQLARSARSGRAPCGSRAEQTAQTRSSAGSRRPGMKVVDRSGVQRARRAAE